jgi:hypothetical protein
MLCCVRMTCKHSRGGSVIAGPRLMHGACEGIRMKTPWLQSGAVESTRFAQMVAVPSNYCSTIDDLGCKITVFSSPSPDSRRAAVFLRRSTSHLPKPSSPGFLAASYFRSPRRHDCSSFQWHISLRLQSPATIILSCTPRRRPESLE